MVFLLVFLLLVRERSLQEREQLRVIPHNVNVCVCCGASDKAVTPTVPEVWLADDATAVWSASALLEWWHHLVQVLLALLLANIKDFS